MVSQPRKRTVTITEHQRTMKADRYKDDTVIIKTTDKTYAEIFRVIKQEVDIQNSNINVKKIRKTKTLLRDTS